MNGDEKRASADVREPTLVSVVVPMFNEEATVEVFYSRLAEVLESLDWEMVAVDDGSADRTLEILRRLAARDDRVRVVSLSRNFGHQAAITAGLDHARGDAVAMIDADLQDPPEAVLRLLDRWRQGADVVHGVRRRREGEPWWRLTLIRLFYRLFARFSEIEDIGDSGDFRLLDRRAVDELRGLRERNRYLRGLSVWIGFHQELVEYDRDRRFAGDTKYPFRRLVELAFDGIISFSRVPLRIAAVLGLVVSVLALIGIPVVVVLRLAGEYVPGIASVTIVLLLLGGIQLLTLGIIGEYLGRSYEEAKRRPIYIVDERLNVAEPKRLEQ